MNMNYIRTFQVGEHDVHLYDIDGEGFILEIDKKMFHVYGDEEEVNADMIFKVKYDDFEEWDCVNVATISHGWTGDLVEIGREIIEDYLSILVKE